MYIYNNMCARTNNIIDSRLLTLHFNIYSFSIHDTASF